MFFAAMLAGIFLVVPLGRPAPVARDLLLALVITSVFALLAAFARGVNLSGALAGSAVAFILAARDLRMFYVLLVVFALTFLATRLGLKRKQQLRKAESRGGRSASQVMANLGVAAVIVILAPANWPALALAALAETAADTCSSEVGLAFPGKTLLITNGKAVAPGVDGGVSWHGTASALVAAAVVALAGKLSGVVSGRQALAVLYAGFLGSVVDSLLGGLLERRGYLNNDAVNLLSTAAAVGMLALSL